MRTNECSCCEVPGAQGTTSRKSGPSPSRPGGTRCPCASLCDHRRDDRHADPEEMALVCSLIEADLDRDALDHLHVVARGVLGGKEREADAGAGHDAVDPAAERPAREGVHGDADLLAGPD